MKNKKMLIVLLPIIALGLSSIACNFPGLEAQPGEAADFDALVAERVAQELAAQGLDESGPEDEEEILPGVGEDQDEPANDGEENSQEVPEVIVEESEGVVEEPEVEPEVLGCTDRAGFIADVTVEDGADFSPGDSFTKTWRLRNSGTCTWTSSYDLVFSHGDQMGGPTSLSLAGTVNPGESVDLSVDLTAPSAEGGYQGFWKLRNGEGLIFGIGSNADVAFWVEIEVLEEAPLVEPILEFELLVPLLAMFSSSGTGQHLPDEGCFDLDAGTQVGCGSGDSDFRYQADLDMIGWPPMPEVTLEIQPQHGASFGIYGPGAPASEDCQSAGLSTAHADIDSIYYCYMTSDGKYGNFYPIDASMAHIEFNWGTWNY